MQKTEKNLILFLEGVLYSYSQVFFSKNIILAFTILAITFFDWLAGVSGLIAVLTANLAATLIGFKRNYISQGFYGFNSLLVGLGVGMFYQAGIPFFAVLVFASLLTFLLTIWLEGILGKYGLPYLSWPFLLAIWMVSLATREFTALDISDRGVFLLNEIYRYGGINMVKLYYWFNDLPLHPAILSYFKSLAAIFFQYHVLAGILIALGLLVFSRIAFMLSLLGFFSAYYFYYLIGAQLTDLSYSYIGFNFILTAIALGGIFIIPSRYSFLWVLLLTPLLSIVIISGTAVLQYLQLPTYSLAFNIVVILFLYMLKFRERNYYKPETVAAQYFSPEQNLYNQKNYQSRFDVWSHFQIYMPVMGNWTITQSHNGEHTHKEDWRHAFDFEIADEQGLKYETNGIEAKDYFCFGQVVLAPADGVVQEIQDGIPDNKIGEMNLNNNWGNTIIIHHANKLYTKLSHLKIGSIKVAKGSFVKKGEIIAAVGNSGRSPLPHLHFQVQEEPFIGSKTKDYPIANYIVQQGEKRHLVTYGKPKTNDIICGISKTNILSKAFNFVTGQTIRFEYATGEHQNLTVDWEVKSDMYNSSYIICKTTEAKAYFRNDGSIFSFIHFTGSKDSLLYHFYLTAYKVSLGYYQKLQVKDTFPLTAFKTGLMIYLHDFAAPFYFFLKGNYTLHYEKLEDDLSTSTVYLASEAELLLNSKRLYYSQAKIIITDGRFVHFEVLVDSKKFVAKEVAV
jgi:urea transporter